ncbi:Fibrinogen-like protein 1 [Bulinus truncatus]|nr:Fibrinogen-like protein 1 [Bulinus truncatus]
MSLHGSPIVLIIPIVCVSVFREIHSASTAQHYFLKSTVCGGAEATYYPSVTRSHLDCAFNCAVHSNCTAYHRLNGTFCLLYHWSVQLWWTNCTADNSVQVYVKRSSFCQNGATLASDGTSCQCVDGYIGTYCQSLMEDCSDGYKNGGYRADKKYWIKPILAPNAFQVHCQMSQGTGLTLIQRRTNENVDFNMTWQGYRIGFEINENEDYWLGNDYIHWITSRQEEYGRLLARVLA